MLATAQTGTGKTTAFSLPIIVDLQKHRKPLEAKSASVLILAPTRELAAQIAENIRAYAANTTLKTALVFGGVSLNPQIDELKPGTDILVATPGRLLDLANQGHVKLNRVRTLVLDEADRMLDMGFIHDIEKILKQIPETHRTLLFSATFNDEIKKLASGLLTDPAIVEIEKNKDPTLIAQEGYYIGKKRKRELTRDLIVDNDWQQVLVFTRMKHTANRLADQLKIDGINAATIHGNKSQSVRTKALSGFKSHDIRVLVATDIAARGLDIEGLPHVINYELPSSPEDYLHRIGRTGRAELTGHAVSLVSEDEKDALKAIERLLKKKIPIQKASGYDGPVPDDIAADNTRRDKARAAELQKLRESRRKAREKARSKTASRPQKAEPKKATHDPVKTSNDPKDRFEKKIIRDFCATKKSEKPRVKPKKEKKWLK